MGRGATNMAILLGRNHSSTLLTKSEALLKCKGTMVSHSCLAPQGTLVILDY